MMEAKLANDVNKLAVTCGYGLEVFWIEVFAPFPEKLHASLEPQVTDRNAP